MLPLDDYIAADQEAIDDYFADVDPNLREWTVTYGSPDGQTYFIPGGYNTMVMYCNTAVFEEAGVELPETDWTWDEFYEAGVAIKESSGGVPPSDRVRASSSATSCRGCSPTGRARWTPTGRRPRSTPPRPWRAAEFAKRLIDEELSPVPGGEFDLGAQFADGQLATFGAGRWMTPVIR